LSFTTFGEIQPTLRACCEEQFLVILEYESCFGRLFWMLTNCLAKRAFPGYWKLILFMTILLMMFVTKTMSFTEFFCIYLLVVVIREFDLNTLQFITENGFNIAEGKTDVSWKSRDLLLIGVDLKDGKSVTTSGYPRTIREWVRGTPIAHSIESFQGNEDDVAVQGYMVSSVCLFACSCVRLFM